MADETLKEKTNQQNRGNDSERGQEIRRVVQPPPKPIPEPGTSSFPASLPPTNDAILWASDDENDDEEKLKTSINECVKSVERARSEMRRDEEEILRLKKETQAILARLLAA